MIFLCLASVAFGGTSLAFAGVNGVMTGPSAVGVATSDRTISTYESLDKGFSAFEKETGIRGNRKWDSGSRIECVGFVRAVRPDSLPSTLPSKTAKDMWTNAVKDKWQIGQTPVPGAVMCWKGWPKNTAGHVAIVTDVAKDGAITVWDANWSSSLDGKIRKRIVEDLTNVQGYIYAKESDVPPIMHRATSALERTLAELFVALEPGAPWAKAAASVPSAASLRAEGWRSMPGDDFIAYRIALVKQTPGEIWLAKDSDLIWSTAVLNPDLAKLGLKMPAVKDIRSHGLRVVEASFAVNASRVDAKAIINLIARRWTKPTAAAEIGAPGRSEELGMWDLAVWRTGSQHAAVLWPPYEGVDGEKGESQLMFSRGLAPQQKFPSDRILDVKPIATSGASYVLSLSARPSKPYDTMAGLYWEVSNPLLQVRKRDGAIVNQINLARTLPASIALRRRSLDVQGSFAVLSIYRSGNNTEHRVFRISASSASPSLTPITFQVKGRAHQPSVYSTDAFRISGSTLETRLYDNSYVEWTTQVWRFDSKTNVFTLTKESKKGRADTLFKQPNATEQDIEIIRRSLKKGIASPQDSEAATQDGITESSSLQNWSP